MIDDDRPLVLASASPRRREILTTLRIPFVARPSQVDEALRSGEAPDGYLDRVVRAKLEAVLDGARADARFAAVLAADTIVLHEGVIFGKPADEREAAQMLASLSGKTHEVRTRFAVQRLDREPAAVHLETVTSLVTFRPLTQDEIRRYAASGEGLDKAGAYAVQGLGAFAVQRVAGSYTNIVGLPACELVAALKALALLDAFPR